MVILRILGFLSALPAIAAGGTVEATWGLDVLRPILADARNVRAGFADCTFEGFAPDLVTEHRVASLRRTGEPARIRLKAPHAGLFYPAVVLYDSSGDERLAISVDGAELGVAAANFDDNRERLFFVNEPYRFQGNETIEFRALTSQGRYRVENIILLADKPAPRTRVNAIHEPASEERGPGAEITWMTDWPVVSTVEWEDAAGMIRSTVEKSAQRNHRLLLDERPESFRIVAADCRTAWQPFTPPPQATIRGRFERERIPLNVERTGAFPSTTGLPFPKGALASDRNLRLLDATGGEVPLQTRTLATWEDGSVKWVLLDFAADGAAYTLETGAQVVRKAPEPAIQVSETDGRIEINTGALRFAVSKSRFGLIESAWVAGRRVISPERPPEFQLTAVGGTVYSTLAAAETLALEESGPLRSVIRASGHHRAADGSALFAWIVRLHAYAGRSFLRIQYTFGNDVGSTEFATLKSLVLRIPLDGDGAPITPASIRVRNERERPNGWAEWNGVTLAVRDFWQNYPKDLTVSAAGFELGICPPLRPDEYAAAKGTVDEHRLFYYLQDGLYKFHQGMTKTHEFWLDFGVVPSPLRANTAPLIAMAPPKWYADSRAAGELAPRKPSGVIADYDAAFSRLYGELLVNREKNHEYGMLNFGDWWGERGINWGNSEYDTAHALFLQFLRTGNPAYFRTAEQVESHNRDVDTIHYSPVPTRIGGVYYHSVGHTGRWYPASPVPGKGINVGDTIVDHTFIEGRLDKWFLTGDRRSLESARLTADRYCGNYTRAYDFEVVRQPGWHLVMCMAMYRATGDRYYLNAARIVIERLLERQTAEGAWELADAQPCPGMPPNSGQQTFMVGILLTGLRHYHEATGDPRVAQAILKSVHHTIDHAWSDEARGFRNTPCLNVVPGYGSAFLVFDGFAYAHRLSGDERIRRVMLRGIGASIERMGGMGKSFTQYTRTAPHFIGCIDALSH